MSDKPDDCKTCEGRGYDYLTSRELVERGCSPYGMLHDNKTKPCPTCHGTGKREASDEQA